MKSVGATFDLVIVGSGAAGLFAALCAAREGSVCLIARGDILQSASSWAQGGIAAAMSSDDDPMLHVEDTLRVGRGLCRPSAVHVLAHEAPARIADLVDLGVAFEDDLGLEGGHSRRRIVHAGGAETGARVCQALAAAVLANAAITVLSQTSVIDLWTNPEHGSRCLGVVTDRGPIRARATLLATGGYAALYARTTNPSSSVGDGMALAYRHGAAIADLELVQFHPTALAGSSLLLTEALRGEGAVLVDSSGERFVDELAPRDVVARAIEERGAASLDLRTVERDRFATLMGLIVEAGYDPAREPVPVAPAAHYTLGGVVTDLDGGTGVDGLYAAGECAATGVHGANRLGSNSLLECLVFGRRAALAAAAEPAGPAPASPPELAASLPLLTDGVRKQLWADAGVVRDAAGLERVGGSPHPIARAIAIGALARTESRGCHFRSDEPFEAASFEGRHVIHRQGREATVEEWA